MKIVKWILGCFRRKTKKQKIPEIVIPTSVQSEGPEKLKVDPTIMLRTDLEQEDLSTGAYKEALKKVKRWAEQAYEVPQVSSGFDSPSGDLESPKAFQTMYEPLPRQGVTLKDYEKMDMYNKMAIHACPSRLCDLFIEAIEKEKETIGSDEVQLKPHKKLYDRDSSALRPPADDDIEVMQSLERSIHKPGDENISASESDERKEGIEKWRKLLQGIKPKSISDIQESSAPTLSSGQKGGSSRGMT